MIFSPLHGDFSNKHMKMNLISTVICFGLVTLATVVPAQAATINVTVNGVSYDVSTTTGSYNSLSSTLSSEPWWGDKTLAKTFASTVGT